MVPDRPSGLLGSELQPRPVLERACAECARHLGIHKDAVHERLSGGDRPVHSAFRYALAKAIAAHLGGLGTAFRGVYIYGSAAGETAGPGSDIDVIVVVDHRCAEAERVIRLLNRGFSRGYRAATGFTGPVDLLDVHVVDRDEESEGRGYGAVLRDPWTAPLCLWRATPSTARPDRTSLRPISSR